MNLPGLKMRRRTGGAPQEPDNYSKWGWYAMAVLALAWIIYNLFFDK
ncbi:hypothetical protein H8B15_02505 [Hymenobacter sp. BT507]|uniref:Uncharacterized protein n=1 Tax=Hymenobacter citatus TaxID=2763506 RepID=A0ABR7MFE6_9BACT|nr:hypothetical protein [Hymenobacter citatus]MBC6609776.1 hypothetical protein [Hymenobacter citatus]